MTVAQTGVVDWLGIEETGHIILTIADDLDWASEEEHLFLLQEKLNVYLSFIESGEVFERLIKQTGHRLPASTPIKVSILAKYALPFGAKSFSSIHEAYLRELVSRSHKVVSAPS